MKGKRVKLPPAFEHYRKEIEEESLVSMEDLYLKSEKLFGIGYDADPPAILLRTINASDDTLASFEVINLYDDHFDRTVLLLPDLETWVPEVMKEFKSYMSRLNSNSVSQ